MTCGATACRDGGTVRIADGNTSKQIGSTLFISPRTLEMHVQSTMQKLECRTRAEAVRRLADLGALPQR